MLNLASDQCVQPQVSRLAVWELLQYTLCADVLKLLHTQQSQIRVGGTKRKKNKNILLKAKKNIRYRFRLICFPSVQL